jgi:hypothetical protein
MEVLGLILIVVLFMIGIFLLIFFGRPNASSYTVEYNQKLVESYVSVLPDVKVPCGSLEVKMSELVRACALPSGVLACAGNHEATCFLLNTSLNTTLRQSLEHWGYAYQMNISMAHVYLAPDGNVCTGRKVAAEQPIPLMASGGAPALIKLKLCFP